MSTTDQVMRTALKQIAAIENKLYGSDWEEIDEAREIAAAVLQSLDEVDAGRAIATPPTEPAAAPAGQAEPACMDCNGTGQMFTHANDCDDDLCAINGDMHSCAGRVVQCACTAAPMVEALHKLLEACDDSDSAQYGTLSVSFVRGLATEALAASQATPEAAAPQSGPNVLVPAEMLRQLRHYTECYLMHWPDCGAPTAAEVESELAASQATKQPADRAQRDDLLAVRLYSEGLD